MEIDSQLDRLDLTDTMCRAAKKLALNWSSRATRTRHTSYACLSMA